MLAMLAACSSKPTDRGQQYSDRQVHPAVFTGKPAGCRRGADQRRRLLRSRLIKFVTPRHASIIARATSITRCRSGCARRRLHTRTLRQFGIDAWQMQGVDNYGNVQFTGYYTPVVQARHTRQGEFQYPIYRVCRQSAVSCLPAPASMPAR